jgi:hypothetical protein
MKKPELHGGQRRGLLGITSEVGQKNAGLKAVTLIATLNPVSQVLW